MTQIGQVMRGEIVEPEQMPDTPAAILRRHLVARVAAKAYAAELCAAVERLAELRASPWDRRAAEAAARQALAALPDSATLRAHLEALEDQRPATRDEIAEITGAALAALPSFDAARGAGYVDVLLLALEIEAEARPFPAAAVAAAMLDVAGDERFAPPPAAIVARIRKTQERFSARAGVLRWVLRARRELGAGT